MITHPRKQTSTRLSSAAANLLAKLPKRGVAIVYDYDREAGLQSISLQTLRSICASALAQRETPGQKPKKKAGRRGLR